MIDPRFANAGTMPYGAGYGTQQVPVHYHRRHHHRHHKNKHGSNGGSPVSRDESIHKVDNTHPHYQNGNTPYTSGYGVPYGTDAFAAGGAGGYYQQQQQQYAGGNYGFSNQYQGNTGYNQSQFGGDQGGNPTRHRRHHHRHHRHHAAEAVVGTEQAQGVPEQLIGQRSSSVIDNEGSTGQVRSPAPPVDNETQGAHESHHRHRHHHHRRRSGENTGFSQSRQTQGHTAAGADGYGHINEDLIFIERGDHSPHRQEPPAGYEYKGKIEVQGIDKEHRSHTHSQGSFGTQGPTTVPMPYPVGPPASLSHCPPGWQQMILTAAPGGPCPPGGAIYNGQIIGGAGMAQAGLGGLGGFTGSAAGLGFGGVGPMGAPGSGGGLANLAASLPFPPQGQLVADYIVESSAGGVTSSGGSGFATDIKQQTGGTGFTEQHHGEHTEEHSSSKATIIEVWQKRTKQTEHEEGPKPDAAFDFGRFRNELLCAIERAVQGGGTGGRTQVTGHDGGTQTQIHPTTRYDDTKHVEKRKTGAGEVRVIVQPVQPVFYMPRQNEARSTVGTHVGPGPAPVVGPAPAIQQTTSAGSNVVYVPRNVYVPVIKPVFVPRERVIVRPQVIHVARPVLVDRPVPVTQRPIIIDRERPIPVPVRGGGQGVVHTESSRSVREEQNYQENLPVSYEGTSTNYDYGSTQQEQQYTAASTHEVASGYETQAPPVDIPAPEQYQHVEAEQYQHVQAEQYQAEQYQGEQYQAEQYQAEQYQPPPITEQYQHTQAEQYQHTQGVDQYQHTQGADQYQDIQSSNQFNVQQTADSYRESHTNLIQPISAMAGVRPLHCTEPIPIDLLDTTVNPNWQRTDRTTLIRRYGPPAQDIVQRTDQVEQQMYQELRQRSSSGGVQRSDSAASYGSATGGGAIHSESNFVASSTSFSSGNFGDIQSFNQQGFSRHGPDSRPVCINY